MNFICLGFVFFVSNKRQTAQFCMATHLTQGYRLMDRQICPELKTLERWISRLMLDLIFFLISRLNKACSPLLINLQINLPIGIKDIPF